MTDNTLELHWDHFETNAPNTFRKLWNDQDFADVTLATVDDQQIRAHKVILSSCSEFFRNIFVEESTSESSTLLKRHQIQGISIGHGIHLHGSM